jgi:predicted porin
MFVGLKGKEFGQIELGRLKQAYKYMGGVRYDPFVATILQARGNGGMSGGAGPDKAMGHGGFHSNAIGYRGDFGPVNFQLTYNPEDVNGGSMTAGAMFKQENWEVFVALADSGDTGASKEGGRTMQTGDSEYSATKIGGQYKMGMHTISAQMEMIDSDTVGSTATKGTSPSYLYLNYQAKMGNNTFGVGFGQYDSDGATADDVNAAGTQAVSKDVGFLALGVNHYFSKTTRLHAGYRATTTDTNTGNSVIAVGLRKDFK